VQAMRDDPHPSVAPDVVTYGSLIAALERGGQWRKALAVYDEMQVGISKESLF
jgi:pentatricopeptide repeat protein